MSWKSGTASCSATSATPRSWDEAACFSASPVTPLLSVVPRTLRRVKKAQPPPLSYVRCCAVLEHGPGIIPLRGRGRGSARELQQSTSWWFAVEFKYVCRAEEDGGAPTCFVTKPWYVRGEDRSRIRGSSAPACGVVCPGLAEYM